MNEEEKAKSAVEGTEKIGITPEEKAELEQKQLEKDGATTPDDVNGTPDVDLEAAEEADLETEGDDDGVEDELEEDTDNDGVEDENV